MNFLIAFEPGDRFQSPHTSESNQRFFLHIILLLFYHLLIPGLLILFNLDRVCVSHPEPGAQLAAAPRVLVQSV
jgi:hypothetical protein